MLCRNCDYVVNRRRKMILSLYYLLYRFTWVSDVIIYSFIFQILCLAREKKALVKLRCVRLLSATKMCI